MLGRTFRAIFLLVSLLETLFIHALGRTQVSLFLKWIGMGGYRYRVGKFFFKKIRRRAMIFIMYYANTYCPGRKQILYIVF